MVFYFKKVTDEHLAKLAVDKMMDGKSKTRRNDIKKRIDFYYGDQMRYLNDAINDQFLYPDRMKLQAEYYNVTQLIIDELAALYTEEPIREILGGSEKDGDIYASIVETAQLNLVMETVNKLSKLCKNVIVKPVWRDDTVEFDVLTPDVFDVINDPNDKTKAAAIVYASYYNVENAETNPDAFGNSDTVYYYWDKERHFAFTYSMNKNNEIVVEIIKNDGNPGNENPYGVIPIVVVRDGYNINDFFIPGGNDLIVANESINMKITELNYLTKMQTFGIPVRKGGGENQSGIILDPSMTIDLPADSDIAKGANFFFAQPQAKIAEMQKEIEGKLRRIAIKYKLNPDMFVASGNRSSAEALQLQTYHLGKMIKRDKPLYRVYEKQLFEMIKTVYNYHSNDGIAEGTTLFIDFKEVEMPMTPDDRDTHNLALYENGLLSRTNWLMIENPDIETEELAMEKLLLIQAEKDVLGTTEREEQEGKSEANEANEDIKKTDDIESGVINTDVSE